MVCRGSADLPMPEALSRDLRQRIIDAWQAEEGKLSLLRRFQVRYASVKRYIRQRQERGQLTPKPCGVGSLGRWMPQESRWCASCWSSKQARLSPSPF